MLYNLKIIEVEDKCHTVWGWYLTFQSLFFFFFKILHKKAGVYDWWFSVWFNFYKKIIKLNIFYKKTRNQFKLTGFGLVRFFKIKTGLAQFFPIWLGFSVWLDFFPVWLGFFSVWVRFGLFFSVSSL
jgi:hypothetical protein